MDLLFGFFDKIGLIAFDLQKVIASFFHDDARGPLLAMERVGRHGETIQTGLGLEQFLRGFELASIGSFLLIHDCHGTRGAVFGMGQGDGPDDVTDHFSIQSEHARKVPIFPREPIAQGGGERFGVHARKHLIKHAVAWNFIETARASLEGQSELRALIGAQSLSESSDLGNLFGAAQQSHGNERKHGPYRKTAIGAARIRDLLKGFKKAALGSGRQWEDAVGGRHGGGA